MKISLKWFLWFSSIGLYVMFLGGIFYYNLFKWTFDEKLKQEAIDIVRVYAPTLIKGLQINQNAVSLDEMDVMKTIAKDERVAFLLYLNRYGEVRWFKDPTKMGVKFEEFNREIPIQTNAIEEAWVAKSPRVRPVRDQPFYEIAIPLSVRSEVMGLVNMQISRSGVEAVISQAMRKYMLGAAGALLLLGIPLYLFLHHFVLTPILTLRDAIEGVSFKNFDLKFKPRKDEVGDLAQAVGGLLSRVKAQMANITAHEKQRWVAEQKWWQSILQTVVYKNHHAIVVDEDNSVLYTNFPLKAGADPQAKLHLLDVLDTQQQDVLRLVGVALERPNEVVEGDTVFMQEACKVRVVHLEEEGELRRTLILFEPKRETSVLPV